MIPVALVVVLVLLFVWLRFKGAPVPRTKPSAPTSTPVDTFVAEALALELRKVKGLDTEAIRRKLVGTLAGEPDPDVVSAISHDVKDVELEFTKLSHETDAELAVVVRYEDGREGRVAKRIGLGDLPKDVVDELTKRAVTRVYRPWSFSWER
ncbi:MAG: hypothetical protein IPK71_33260 [Myxococcales bacterium]|nr:hypothetical protein [Myxococcales bacterium]